jgi:hypothetical protein
MIMLDHPAVTTLLAVLSLHLAPRSTQASGAVGDFHSVRSGPPHIAAAESRGHHRTAGGTHLGLSYSPGANQEVQAASILAVALLAARSGRTPHPYGTRPTLTRVAPGPTQGGRRLPAARVGGTGPAPTPRAGWAPTPGQTVGARPPFIPWWTHRGIQALSVGKHALELGRLLVWPDDC